MSRLQLLLVALPLLLAAGAPRPGAAACDVPVIREEPVGRESGPCLSNAFSVVVDDSGPPGPYTYRWRVYVNGQPQDLPENAHFSGTTTDTMTINPLRQTDVRSYDVVVSNACGPTVSAPFAIILADGHWVAGAALPNAVERHAMAYDSGRQAMVIFGGGVNLFEPTVGFTESNETWERVGTGAWNVVSQSGPATRQLAGMAYDPVRQRTVLFGGVSCGACDGTAVNSWFADTWEWDGTSWTERQVTGPSARGAHSMAWDPVRQRVQLICGRGTNFSEIGDHWEWDGTAWSQRGGGPLADHGLGLAYDSRRSVLVMHGDAGQSGRTFEFTGTQWVLRFTAAFGSGLRGGGTGNSALAFDSVRGSTLLATPPDDAGTNPIGELWEWRGTGTWERKRDRAPLWRYFTQMAYDSARNRTVLSGGSHGNQRVPPVSGNRVDTLSDTWEWTFFDGDPTCGITSCGDGIIDTGEQCDSNSSCCTASCTFVAVGSACGDLCTGDACGSGQCQPGGLAPGACSATSSTSAVIGAAGGALATPDGSVEVIVPAGALAQPRTIAIAGGLGASSFGVGTATTRAMVVRLGQPGTTFAVPVTVRFRWPDASPVDGLVDGLLIPEAELRVYKDGAAITPQCQLLPAPATPCPTCCDPVANQWEIAVSSFSEFVVVQEACVSFADPKLGLSKILAPAGDDGLSFKGEVTLPPAALALDPIVEGFGVAITNAGGTVLDVTIPAGAFDKTSKTGWKVDRKHTKWSYSTPKGKGLAGIVKVALGLKKGILKVGLTGARGAYPATPPMGVRILLPGSGTCASTAFDQGEQSCVIKNKGKSLRCH